MPPTPGAGLPSGILIRDMLADSSINTNLWDTRVEVGSSAITETNYLNVINTGAGTAGISYLPSLLKFGKHTVISVDITVTDGESAGDGERCEASLVLYKDASNYMRFGVYRDTGDAVNSSGYLRYNIAGAGEVTSDLTGDNVDNNIHQVQFKVLEYFVEVYYDGAYQTAIAFNDMINYNVWLEAGTQNNADIINIKFSRFMLNNDLTSTTVSSSLGGAIGSVGSGIIELPDANMVTREFTEAEYGMGFEIDFMADLDATDGFESFATTSGLIDVTIWKKLNGAYINDPNDIMGFQQGNIDRCVDVERLRCHSDTKIGFQLDDTPHTTVEIPYNYLIISGKE